MYSRNSTNTFNVQYNTEKTHYVCPHKNGGGCGNFVSPKMCNNCLSIYGLYARDVNYTDANNNTTSSIVLHITSIFKFQLPLFIDERGIVDTEEVMQFVNTRCSYFPSLNKDEFFNVLLALLDLQIQPECFKLDSWLNDSSVSIPIFEDGKPLLHVYNKPLPKLHQILLKHAIPSVQRTDRFKAEEVTKLYIENIALIRNPSTGKLNFEVLKPENVAKWTNLENCIATPLVLAAQFETNGNERVKQFTRRAC